MTTETISDANLDKLLDDFAHFEYCPVCRSGLDTGLECSKCGADYMQIVKALGELQQRRAGDARAQERMKELEQCAGELMRVLEAYVTAEYAWRLRARTRAALAAKPAETSTCEHDYEYGTNPALKSNRLGACKKCGNVVVVAPTKADDNGEGEA